jgi:uncharacterized Fe-S cluster protein YjdI/CDGSH-type Zn-finger protein
MARHLQVYTHDALVVTFDPARCIHAATCVRLLPAVFDAKARPWIRPDAADATTILDVVRRCPSGALKASMEGAAVDVDGDNVALQVGRDGPLVVRGPVTIVDEHTGATLVEDVRVVLCRCGQSARKPFCDGAHRRARFRDPADGRETVHE